MDTFFLKIPNKAEYISSVRLFVSGIISNFETDIETIEDIKMAVTEGLNIAFNLQCKDIINIEFNVGEDLKIKIEEICKEKIEKLEELNLSKTIIECLVDEIYLEEKTLYMTKKF